VTAPAVHRAKVVGAWITKTDDGRVHVRVKVELAGGDRIEFEQTGELFAMVPRDPWGLRSSLVLEAVPGVPTRLVPDEAAA
jgi:hypothetical protein